MRAALAIVCLTLVCGSAQASAASPVLEGEWKFSGRVVKDTTGKSIKLPPGQRYRSLVGTRTTEEFDFRRCVDCPGIFKFAIGAAPDLKLVRLRRRGGLLVVNYGCRHPCTRSRRRGPKTGCRHWMILKLRVGRSFDFEGLRLAQTATGTLERRTDPCRGALRRVVYRFKARRTERPVADSTDVTYSSVTPCDALAVRLQADTAGSSYQWDFGDGTSSTEAAPTHRYAAHGSYNVKVRVLTNGWVATGSAVVLTDPDQCG